MLKKTLSSVEETFFLYEAFLNSNLVVNTNIPHQRVGSLGSWSPRPSTLNPGSSAPNLK